MSYKKRIKNICQEIDRLSKSKTPCNRALILILENEIQNVKIGHETGG
jgi:hypothetical protein